MNGLDRRDLDLLRVLHFAGGTRIIREFANKTAYSHLAEKGYVVETTLQHGDVHVILTDAGRRALQDIIR